MVCPQWAAELESRTRVDADNRSLTNPLTGEPDAGDPPVRFGGRGSGKPLSLPLSSPVPGEGVLFAGQTAVALAPIPHRGFITANVASLFAPRPGLVLLRDVN